MTLEGFPILEQAVLGLLLQKCRLRLRDAYLMRTNPTMKAKELQELGEERPLTRGKTRRLKEQMEKQGPLTRGKARKLKP